eukprot:1534537-Prymnesium_polylepis.2
MVCSDVLARMLAYRSLPQRAAHSAHQVSTERTPGVNGAHTRCRRRAWACMCGSCKRPCEFDARRGSPTHS